MLEKDDAWSDWILLANLENFDVDKIDDCGAACYELGLKPRSSWFGSVEIVYVGETCNLRARASSYGRDGSHLNDIIHTHLKRGYDLYIRFQLFRTKRHAVAFQNELLDEYDYDWNIVRNCEIGYHEEE